MFEKSNNIFIEIKIVPSGIRELYVKAIRKEAGVNIFSNNRPKGMLIPTVVK